MKIEKILEYQEVDRKLYAIENDFRKSKEVDAVITLQNKYKEDKLTLARFTKEAGEVMATFSKCAEKLDEATVGEQRLVDASDLLDSEDAIDSYDRELAQYQENVIAVEKEASKLIKRLTDIKAEIQKTRSQISAVNTKYKQVKELHDKKQKEMQQKALPYMKELKALKDQIDEKLLKKYNELRAARKMPAFVPYMDGNCFACGMDIAVEVEKYLNEAGDYTECPNCRRIVYKK